MKVKDCSLIRPLTCKPNDTSAQAAMILRDSKQRRAIVVDEEEHPIGIVSTTDMSNKVVAEGKEPAKVLVKEIMSSPVYLTCCVDEELAGIYKKMLAHESFFVPVTHQGRLYGILTYGEIVKQVEKAVNDAAR